MVVRKTKLVTVVGKRATSVATAPPSKTVAATKEVLVVVRKTKLVTVAVKWATSVVTALAAAVSRVAILVATTVAAVATTVANRGTFLETAPPVETTATTTVIATVVAKRATSPETAHKAAAVAATTTTVTAAVVGAHATVAVKRDISPETAPTTTTNKDKITIRGLRQWPMIVERQWSVHGCVNCMDVCLDVICKTNNSVMLKML